ncbi:MAG: hypothetical protein MPJ24_09890 [Pirellulaceae bacterium]|nr:hypothetical protein [Pirellulaceae bacterium]
MIDDKPPTREELLDGVPPEEHKGIWGIFGGKTKQEFEDIVLDYVCSFEEMFEYLADKPFAYYFEPTVNALRREKAEYRHYLSMLGFLEYCDPAPVSVCVDYMLEFCEYGCEIFAPENLGNRKIYQISDFPISSGLWGPFEFEHLLEDKHQKIIRAFLKSVGLDTKHLSNSEEDNNKRFNFISANRAIIDDLPEEEVRKAIPEGEIESLSTLEAVWWYEELKTVAEYGRPITWYEEILAATLYKRYAKQRERYSSFKEKNK